MTDADSGPSNDQQFAQQRSGLRRYRWILVFANVVAIYVLVWLTAVTDDNADPDDSAAAGSSTTVTTEPNTDPTSSTVTTAAPGDSTSSSSSSISIDPDAGSIASFVLLQTETTRLAEAFEAAGLLDSLDSGPLTLFAPTDEAFTSADPDTLDAILADPEGLLSATLLHHLAEGALDAEMLAAQGGATMLDGEDLSAFLVEGTELAVGNGVIATSSVEIGDSIVHTIDRLLLPASVSSTLTASQLSELFQLDPIRFDDASAVIREESFATLSEAVEILTDQPDARVEIGGHTDDVGTPEGNQRLSERRAQAVLAFLVENGVDADRLTAVGYGQNQPIADNGTAEGRAENRRIEFTAIDP